MPGMTGGGAVEVRPLGMGTESAESATRNPRSAMFLTRIVEEVARTDGARVLAGLIRLAGDFDAAEDA